MVDLLKKFASPLLLLLILTFHHVLAAFQLGFHCDSEIQHIRMLNLRQVSILFKLGYRDLCKVKLKQKAGADLVHVCLVALFVSSSLRPHGLQPSSLLCPCGFLGKNAGVGCHALLQDVFLTQRLNPGLLHCRWILYQLSYQGSLA